MKPIVQRRRSTPSAITKALSKSKCHSRETTLSSSHSENGLPSGVFSSPGSTFILDERVQLTVGLQTQERHLILFSDVLVIAKSKSSSSLKLKKQVHLSEVWTGTCLSEVTEKKMGPENSFVIGWPTTNYVVTFRDAFPTGIHVQPLVSQSKLNGSSIFFTSLRPGSADVKERWLSALLWHINAAKQNEYLKNLTLQIFVLDADNGSSTTAVSVSNVETAESVMKKTLLQLGLPGRTSEHHLWVISGKDDPAYPLIGHEHPFSIALNCLRDSADQQQGTNNNNLLADGTEPSFLDQLPKEKQCQFVMKPRLQAPVQLRRESLQKHTKRKKSLIDWALRRSTSTPTGSPPSQSPTTPRKLFGLSLSSVCPDGILPKPIMDMLLLLYHEGPSTRGIFRRSANAKTCKELKEKLNSGDDVQVDGESVFVAAAVITDFLRNIPDSVLSSDMHGLWMEAVDTENRAHKIEAIKSLVNQLPEANLILLRHLFGVLHHIEQNSGVNQMNAFNLALCIAPNMLWLPSPTGPEEESRSTKKVALLVQFLIENSGEIFGGDIASLFQRPEIKKSKNSEESLGLSQHDDSSDELEFSACDPEGPKHHLVPETDAIFEPSSSLLLDEDQEDWDLFSEITACYQSQAQRNTSTDSCELLEEEGSFCSLGSIRSLSPARDRCSSEPSVCLSSQLPAPSHEPVARQSSCDATIMHSHTDYIHRLKQLQMESQKLIDESLSPVASKARQNLWPSPQTSSQPKQLGLQKSSLSNRSSFSSLSSATTSPSASSLSSLDSAFSYCSESSAISPTDPSSLPFMFGTSARLHAVSPRIAKRSPKEWHKSFTSPVPLHPCELDSSHGYEHKAAESSHCSGGRKSFPSVSKAAVGSPLADTDQEEERQLSCVGDTVPGLRSQDYTKELNPELPAPSLTSEKSLQSSHQQHREKAVKNTETKRADACPPSQESLKRTKITFYVAPNKESSWGSPVEEAEERYMAKTSSSDSPSSSEHSLSKSLQTVRVHIPQTVFYGQNTPLVLQSISRHSSLDPGLPSLQAEHGEAPQSASSPKELETEPVEVAQAPTPSKGFNTFSHTIRIILPASIRHTVREYFRHDETKACPTAEAEMVENELLRSRVEWLKSQPLAEAGTEERDTVAFAEETFV